MNKGFDLGNYVEVPDRIVQFYQRYPEGRIAEVGKPDVVTVKDKTFIGVTVAVYRGPDDTTPCVGTAWEPFPGATPYTRDSEMMNAATSAIGRALVAAGILAKGEKVASREEIRSRSDGEEAKKPETLKKYDAQIKKMTLGSPQSTQQDERSGAPHLAVPAPATTPAASTGEDAPLGLLGDREKGQDGNSSGAPAGTLVAPPSTSSPVVPDVDDRQPLYALARSLKQPRTAVEVDAKIAKQGIGPVRMELVLAHSRDHGPACVHVTELAGLMASGEKK